MEPLPQPEGDDDYAIDHTLHIQRCTANTQSTCSGVVTFTAKPRFREVSAGGGSGGVTWAALGCAVFLVLMGFVCGSFIERWVGFPVYRQNHGERAVILGSAKDQQRIQHPSYGQIRWPRYRVLAF